LIGRQIERAEEGGKGNKISGEEKKIPQVHDVEKQPKMNLNMFLKPEYASHPLKSTQLRIVYGFRREY